MTTRFRVVNPEDTVQQQQAFPWKMFLLTSAAGVAIGLIVGDIYRAVKNKSINMLLPNPSVPPAPPPYVYPPGYYPPPPQQTETRTLSQEELLMWQQRLEHMHDEVMRKARHFNLIA